MADSEDGLADMDKDTSADGGASQHTILSVAHGRVFLQKEALVNSDEGLDLDDMVSTLIQILPRKACQQQQETLCNQLHLS